MNEQEFLIPHHLRRTGQPVPRSVTHAFTRLPEWSPLVYLFLIALPATTFIFGCLVEKPILATALALPSATIIAWFFQLRGVLLSIVLVLVGYEISHAFNWASTAPWDDTVVSVALVGVLSWMVASLRLVIDEARRIAGTDALTGLLNQPQFMICLEAEANRLKRTGRPLAVVFLDCDKFKQLNDTFGHQVGDRFLQEAAASLAGSVRSYDYVARMGGDEFAILYSDLHFAHAEAIVHRVLDRLKQLECPADVGWSVGVACFEEAAAAEFMIKAADKLMYQAKANDRRAVVIDRIAVPPETLSMRESA